MLALVSVTLKPAAAGCGACRRGRRCDSPLPLPRHHYLLLLPRWARGIAPGRIRDSNRPPFRVSAWQSDVV